MTVTQTGEFKMLINGLLVGGNDCPFPVVNPATGLPVSGACPHASQDQVEEAVVGSQSAFELWSCKTLDELKAAFSGFPAEVRTLVSAIKDEMKDALS